MSGCDPEGYRKHDTVNSATAMAECTMRRTGPERGRQRGGPGIVWHDCNIRACSGSPCCSGTTFELDTVSNYW